MKTYATDERAARPLFDRPHTEAAKLPVANQHGHLPPRDVPAEDPSVSNVAHDLRVRTHCGVGVYVSVAEGPEQQALGFKRQHITLSERRTAQPNL
jgi:hypothetical protein